MAIGAGHLPSGVDVLIAGAGPAGSAAALACRAAGFSVVLLNPPQPPSGAARAWETLHPEAVSLLNLLHASDAVARSAIARMVSFRSNGGRRRLGYGSHPGWHIDRDLFDAVLLERAGSAGAKVAGAALARAEAAAFGIAGQLSSGVAIEARWLIDATGRRRVASRSLGSRYRRLSPALISRTGLLHGSAAGHRGTEFSAHEWGWTWITAAHRRQRTWTAVHAARAEPSERIRHLLAHCLPDTVRTSSATWFVTESNGSAAILPIGDAAGAIDPAGGLGVANALASGLAAGRTIALAAAQPAATARHVARYHEWWAERVDGQASALRSLYEESRIQLV